MKASEIAAIGNRIRMNVTGDFHLSVSERLFLYNLVQTAWEEKFRDENGSNEIVFAPCNEYPAVCHGHGTCENCKNMDMVYKFDNSLGTREPFSLCYLCIRKFLKI